MSDRLTVAKSTVVGDNLQRMPHRVAEIQDPPQPAFPFILMNYVGLDLAAGGNQEGQLLEIAPLQGLNVGYESVEQSTVSYNPIFQGLEESRIHFSTWQGCQNLRVYHDQGRLIKAAYQILSESMVHSRFAAYRAVDLGEQ